MIKNIVVFGDSFMYGHETNYRQFVNDEFKEKFKEKVGRKFDRLGFDHVRSGQIKMNLEFSSIRECVYLRRKRNLFGC